MPLGVKFVTQRGRLNKGTEQIARDNRDWLPGECWLSCLAAICFKGWYKQWTLTTYDKSTTEYSIEFKYCAYHK